MKTFYLTLGILGVVLLVLVIGVLVGVATGGGGSGPYVYYRTCEEAKASGVGPFHSGDPRYRPELDRNGDGVACE